MDIWVRKYDTAGDELWTHTHAGPARETDSAYGADMFPDGSVVVVGEEIALDEDGGNNVWVRKYTPDGTEEWTATYDVAGSIDRGIDVVVDPFEDVVVVGSIDAGADAGGSNIWIAKYAG